MTLGRTSVNVTRLGLGTTPLGWMPVGQEETGRAIVRRAAALGLRYVDTAPEYGYGEAERRLGEVMSEIGRTAVVLETKVGRSLRPASPLRKALRAARNTAMRREQRGAGQSYERVADFSYDGIMRSLDQSLERLRTDHADILLLHEPAGEVGPVMDGGYRALERLRADGRVGAIGVGLNEVQPLIGFIEAGDFDCILLALRYTLLDQTAAERLLPLAASRQVAVIAGGVFNSGILADPRPGASYDYAKAPDPVVRRAQRLGEVCASHGISLKAAALQFPFRHPAVTSVLTGVVSVAELEENVAAFEVDIPDALWDDLRAEGLITGR